MAWGSVNSVKDYFSGNSQTKAITVAAGDLIVITLHMYDANEGTTAITDTAGNTYTKRLWQNGGDGALVLAIYDAIAVSGGTITVTINPGGTTTYCSYTIAWRSGADQAARFDVSDPNTGTSTSPSGGPITPTQSGDWLVGAMTSMASGSVAITPDGDYTQLQEYEDGAANMHMNVQSRDYNSVSADTANWTLASSQSWIGAVAAYKKAADTTFSLPPLNAARRNHHLFVR